MSTHSLPTTWYRNFFTGPSVRFWDAALPPAVTQREVSALVADLQLSASSPLPVLDIACGTGRHAAPLAQLGYPVFGVDISEESLALARERSQGWPAEYHLADLDLWEPSRSFQAAYWLGNGLTYLPPPRFAAWLARLHAALPPGARFLAETGCCAESFFSQWEEKDWYEAGGILMTLENTFHPQEGCLHTAMRFFENGQESRSEALHYVYTAAELLRIFTAAGFRLLQLSSSSPPEPYTPQSPAARFLLEA